VIYFTIHSFINKRCAINQKGYRVDRFTVESMYFVYIVANIQLKKEW